jgi:hypothetical protein
MLKAQRHLVERRKGRRHNLTWPVRVIGIDSASAHFDETTTLENLSSGGAFLYLNVCPQVGAKLSITIKLPLGNQILMGYTAVVVRVEKELARVGIALKFETSRPRFDHLQDLCSSAI